MKKHWGLNNASQRGTKWRRGWGRRGRLKMRKKKNPNELKEKEQKNKMASRIGKASRATSTLKYPSLPSSISSSSSSLLFSMSSFQVYSWTKMTWRYRASETSSSTLSVIIAIEAFPLSSPCPRLSTQRCFFPLYAFFCIPPPLFSSSSPPLCVCARARFFSRFLSCGITSWVNVIGHHDK